MNIGYHNLRFNTTRRELFNIHSETDLAQHISLPENIPDGILKCRLTYGLEIYKTEFEPYVRREISSLKMVEDNDLDYAYKFADRAGIGRLFDRRGDCDEILIVRKGLLTDTSYANIALWDGRTWHTPSTPLLHGTARARLIDEHGIVESELRPGDLYKYQKIRFFNAMMDVEMPLDRLLIRT